MTLNLEDLEATAQALTYRGGNEQMLALDAIALIAKLREAEAVIAKAREELRAASIPPGMTEAMFNRVLMVLADMTLATYKHTNQEGGNDGT